jgi:hypothetical protein
MRATGKPRSEEIVRTVRRLSGRHPAGVEAERMRLAAQRA